jgi:hypothetical protein
LDSKEPYKIERASEISYAFTDWLKHCLSLGGVMILAKPAIQQFKKEWEDSKWPWQEHHKNLLLN